MDDGGYRPEDLRHTRRSHHLERPEWLAQWHRERGWMMRDLLGRVAWLIVLFWAILYGVVDDLLRWIKGKW